MMLSKRNTHRIVLITRIFLGVLYLFSGLAKLIHGFPNTMGPPWLIGTLAPYGLATFAYFIAVSEAVIGALLLTQRFATLGAIMLFPLQACILMVTISLGWQGTPYVNAFLILLNTGLLLYDWPKLKFIFTDKTSFTKSIPFERQSPKMDAVWIAGMTLFITGMLFLTTIPSFKYLSYAGVFIMLAPPLLARWSSVL